MAVTLDSAVLNPDNLSPNAKSVQVTERALDRIRAAMATEAVSPEQGGLRLGVQGGGFAGRHLERIGERRTCPRPGVAAQDHRTPDAQSVRGGRLEKPV